MPNFYQSVCRIAAAIINHCFIAIESQKSGKSGYSSFIEGATEVLGPTLLCGKKGE